MATAPESTRKPGVYIGQDWTGATGTMPANRERCLIIAPVQGSASAELNKIVDVFTDNVGDLFGAESAAAGMVRAAIGANPALSLSVCPVATSATDISAALANIFAAGHTMIATSFMDATSRTALRDYLESVATPIEQRPAILCAASTATLAEATTWAAGMNLGHSSLAFLPGTTTPAHELAAAYMAVLASEEDPAMPHNTLEIKGISLPPLEKYLSRTEQETLLYAGVTPLEVSSDGRVQIVRAVTTYTQNATGEEDASQLDVHKVRSADYVCRYIRQQLRLKYPRAKYSPRIASAVWATVYACLGKLEEAEIVTDVDANRGKLSVTPSAVQPGRMNISIPAKIIEGLHVIAGELVIVA